MNQETTVKESYEWDDDCYSQLQVPSSRVVFKFIVYVHHLILISLSIIRYSSFLSPAKVKENNIIRDSAICMQAWAQDNEDNNKLK